MEELLVNIEKVSTGMVVGIWLCFFCLAFLCLNVFFNEYYKNKEREKKELKESIRKELEK